jgi:hypothetical protein
MAKVTDHCGLSTGEMDLLLKYEIPLIAHIISNYTKLIIFPDGNSSKSYVMTIERNKLNRYHWNCYDTVIGPESPCIGHFCEIKKIDYDPQCEVIVESVEECWLGKIYQCSIIYHGRNITFEFNPNYNKLLFRYMIYK